MNLDWLPWVRSRRAAEAEQAARRDERADCWARAKERAAEEPYRVLQRADGLWRVERAYVRPYPYPFTVVDVGWVPVRFAGRLASREDALAAIQRELSPVEIKVGPDGVPIQGSGA